MKEYTSNTYAQIYFGAYTHTTSGSDYHEYYCKARVDFNYVAFI